MRQAEKPWGFVLEPLFPDAVGFLRDSMKRVIRLTSVSHLNITKVLGWLGNLPSSYMSSEKKGAEKQVAIKIS